MAIYNIAQPTGAMLSGAMQGALATNLNGSLGRAGWRWAFIVNVYLSPNEKGPSPAGRENVTSRVGERVATILYTVDYRLTF
jgi:hypothetical protein